MYVLYRIDTKHEKFNIEVNTLRPIKYDRIHDILNELVVRFDWDKIMEEDNVMGLLFPFCMNVVGDISSTNN
jgi:glutamate--cysteine ligase